MLKKLLSLLIHFLQYQATIPLLTTTELASFLVSALRMQSKLMNCHDVTPMSVCTSLRCINKGACTPSSSCQRWCGRGQHRKWAGLHETCGWCACAEWAREERLLYPSLIVRSSTRFKSVDKNSDGK